MQHAVQFTAIALVTRGFSCSAVRDLFSAFEFLLRNRPMGIYQLATTANVCSVLAFATFVACKSTPTKAGADAASEASTPLSVMSPTPTGPAPTHTDGAFGMKQVVPSGPVIGAVGYEVTIWDRPSKSSGKKIGLLRVGGIVARDEKPVSGDGCGGGDGKGGSFYKVQPTGYVCAAEGEGSLDPNHPVLQAAWLRPDPSRPLPYAYAFVRAVAPLYLKVPTKAEQDKSEFKLKEHLASHEKLEADWSKVPLGANDVELPGKPPPIKKSNELSLSQLFGAQGIDYDPIPPWLEGGRKIPNISSFKVPTYAVFANRVRRHTGLALVTSFKGGEAAGDRPFAVTTDLRLVPTTKIKPETGSMWHGTDVDASLPLPFAFVRKDCRDPKKKTERKDPDCIPHTYTIAGEDVKKDKPLKFRSTVKLTGKAKRLGDKRYREIEGGQYVLAGDVGAVMEPAEWPAVAAKGEKWIEVSILNQTLILWEGKKAVYATLVSTGQDGIRDHKTTKSTIQGTFRIRNKFITAMMDSNEKSGGAEKAVSAKDKPEKAEKPEKSEKADKGEEGKTIRRGAGGFELRDVPYVQYFEGAYALHVAYWHDVFGTARSHGCVNLSPIDGQRIFSWTEPPLPSNWHGIDNTAGTTIVVHE
jgi:lipoprotein-anchoring transpeptidase ErfK/SrfK